MQLSSELFVSSNVAFAVAKAGFDEPCLAIWDAYNGGHHFIDKPAAGQHEADYLCDGSCTAVVAPLYDQVINWLIRNKIYLTWDRQVKDKENEFVFFYIIKNGNGFDTTPIFSGEFDSRQECLNAGILKATNLLK